MLCGFSIRVDEQGIFTERMVSEMAFLKKICAMLVMAGFLVAGTTVMVGCGPDNTAAQKDKDKAGKDAAKDKDKAGTPPAGAKDKDAAKDKDKPAAP